MKVLMIGNSPKVKGGINSVISQLLSYDWSKAGVCMSFIPTYDGGSAIHKIIYFGKAYSKIRSYIKKSKPDIVHIHMSYKGSFTRKYMIHKLCKKGGIHDILHLHGSEFKNWYDRLSSREKSKVRKLLKECDEVVVLGNKYDQIVKNIEPKAKTVIIGNSVRIPEQVVKWDEERFQILFMGVLIKRKGVSNLLQAVKIITDNDPFAKLHILIAGAGEAENELKDVSEKLEINSIVDFVGWVVGEEKEKMLAKSQLFVLPSYNEGLPIAILEAISYGLPVVATNVGDVSSAVHDGENGFYGTEY